MIIIIRMIQQSAGYGDFLGSFRVRGRCEIRAPLSPAIRDRHERVQGGRGSRGGGQLFAECNRTALFLPRCCWDDAERERKILTGGNCKRGELLNRDSSHVQTEEKRRWRDRERQKRRERERGRQRVEERETPNVAYTQR